VAYLVAERSVPAEACLAITFTRRAAAELSERLAELLPAGSGEPFVATFHALALAICREQFAALGFDALPKVADEADTAAVLLELDADPSKPVPESLFDAYRKLLRSRGLLELDELVPLAAGLLEASKLKAVYRARWPHVLVDEYQDVDASQYALLRALVPADGSLFAIGDPDQSIYSFRGADVGFFLRFAEDYPAATTVTLTRNYRSAPPIVATAVQAVRPGSLVPGRALSAERRDLGAARIAVHRIGTENEEAGYVAATIDALVGGSSFHSLDSGRVDGADSGEAVPVGFGDIAVLYRTDAQSRALLSAFGAAGLPSQKRGVDRLADRPGVPALLREMAVISGDSLLGRLRSAASELASRSSMPDLFGEVTTVPEAEIWSAVELLRPLAEFHGSDDEGFRAAVATGAEVDALDPRADAITLLTLHAAKGLEFPVVFLVGCSDGLVPMRWPGGSAEEQEARLAEERRLFFVGLTRAKRRLFLSAPRTITRRGSSVEAAVTPFLAPVDAGLLEQTGSEEPRRPAARQMRLI
jgi:superfamily I DNA/RNA helicase